MSYLNFYSGLFGMGLVVWVWLKIRTPPPPPPPPPPPSSRSSPGTGSVQSPDPAAQVSTNRPERVHRDAPGSLDSIEGYSERDQFLMSIEDDIDNGVAGPSDYFDYACANDEDFDWDE